MYLTDIRGFTAEDYIVCNADNFDISLCDGGKPMFAAAATPLAKITVHGMGVRGDKGLSLHFARFCLECGIEPRFISLSDMGISFFVPKEQKEFVLDSLCDFFPMWE